MDIFEHLKSLPSYRRELFIRELPSKLAELGEVEQFTACLMDFDYLSIRIYEFELRKIIDDYNFLSHPHILKNPEYNSEKAEKLLLIQKALQKSASIIEEDSQELPSRLWGHLRREQSPWIQKFLGQAIESKAKSNKPCWLRPLEANLSVPDTPLETTFTGHSGGVDSLALTSDGGTLVSGSEKQIKIWDLGSLTPRHTINFGSGEVLRKYDLLIFNNDIIAMLAHTRYVKALAITSDDSILISGSSDGVLRVWDLHSRKLLKKLEIILSQFAEFDEDHLHDYINLSRYKNEPINPYNAINALAAIPGTHFVVVGCKDGFVFLYDIDRGTLHFNYRHDEPVHAAITSADGELIVTGAEESIIVCDWKKGNTLIFQTNMNSFTLPYFPHAGCSRNLAITSDKSKLLTTTPYSVYVWDLQSYKCLFELEHSKKVKSATLTPDGKKIIVGQALGDVVVWDISKNIPQQVPKVPPKQPKKGLFSKLRNIFSSPAESEQIEEERPLTGEKVATLKGHAYHVDALTVTPDGKYAISAAEEIKLWRLDRLEQTSESLAQHGWTVQAVTVSPNGKYFASTEGNWIKIWDLPTREILHIIHTVRYLGDSGCLLITPDSQRLIAGSLEAINFYNLETGEKEDSVSVQGSLIHALAISSDGRQLLSWGDCQSGVESGDTLRIWDIGGSKAKQIGALLNSSDNQDSILEVAITPDGKQALSTSLNQNSITVWDLETKKIIKTIPPKTNKKRRRVTLFDGSVDSSVELERILSQSVNKCHSPFVLTPDGNYLIATSPLFFSVIHLETRQKIVEVPPPERGVVGKRHHYAIVTDIAVAPNGQWFVSISADATIKVWELPTGHNLATFSGESNPFTCCTVAPDNCTIIAGDVSGQVHFFKFEGFVEGRSVVSPPIIPSLDEIKIEPFASESASSNPNYPATTSESLPTQIKQDIKSKEEYYKNSLENSLSKKNWQEANRITFGWLSDIMHEDNFEKLHLLDTFWLKYSDNHFGFSVQKRIWEESNRNTKEFCKRVGWNIVDDINEYKIEFESSTEGQLPARNYKGVTDLEALFSLIDRKYEWLNLFCLSRQNYEILLKGLPNHQAYLSFQLKGKGIIELRLYQNNNYYLKKSFIYQEEKEHDTELIYIKLPNNLCQQKISGSLIFKSLFDDEIKSFYIKINISSPIDNNNPKLIELQKAFQLGDIGIYRFLELQKEILGKEHFDILPTLEKLISKSEKMGNYLEAEILKNQKKNVYERNNHPKLEIGKGKSKFILFLSSDEMGFSTDIDKVE